MYINVENFIATIEIISNSHEVDEEHPKRVAVLSVEIGKKIKLSEERLQLLEYAARIHDIGQCGVDDIVKAKTTRLTKSQRAAMNEHCRIGYDYLAKSSLPNDILLTVLYHHEHWDGSGYPDGLREEEIPQLARIVAIADCYDGISSKRVYHEA